MKTYKVKDQEEAVKNAKLFYKAVKLAWGLQVTYCYHDLIHMIKNDLGYDLYVVHQQDRLLLSQLHLTFPPVWTE